MLPYLYRDQTVAADNFGAEVPGIRHKMHPFPPDSRVLCVHVSPEFGFRSRANPIPYTKRKTALVGVGRIRIPTVH